MSEEPHRVLVEAVLARRGRRAGGLWEAAVRRHMELAEAPEAAASKAVTQLVGQMVGLREDAAWFRDDARLRERAISETLLYCTGLSHDVPSRAAQEAWAWYFGLPDPRSGAPAREAWRQAWTAWATSN
jgi:hypothetical protein